MAALRHNLGRLVGGQPIPKAAFLLCGCDWHTQRVISLGLRLPILAAIPFPVPDVAAAICEARM